MADILLQGTKVKIDRSLLQNTTPVLTAIGKRITSNIQRTFRDQGREGVKWIARRVPNIGGILTDLAKGTKIKDRRWDARPALRDTGNLLSSITFQITGKFTVEVGSALPYASLHNKGGQSVIPVTSTIKENLKILLRKTRKKVKKLKSAQTLKLQEAEKKSKTLARADQLQALGWLFRKDNVTINVPQRKFAFISSNELKQLGAIINKAYKKEALGGESVA